MSEAENASGGDYGGSEKVVQFRARPATKQSEPYLCDEERLALRRLIALEKKIALAIRKLELLEVACPTAKREIRAMLLDN